MLCLLQWMRVKKNLQLVQHLTMSAARKDSPLARITLARVTPLSVVLPVKSGQIQRGGLSSGTTTTVETPMGNQGVFLASQRTQMLNTVQSRAGHAYAEYANDADYANMRMRMRIENLIHIIHI